ncbi:TetR/AcrR family transcriptional regulator [Algoriphagus mannitolivorans]|uniref:TetR/AcrR family transcriptional regulator n=1 Tax=Algoriphagus mannitolivorans TaxID=226504 RepID=UPI001FE1321D|nr:TetR/AcrR family transcriptional regulator [Algoriphagus mannitolivorans]
MDIAKEQFSKFGARTVTMEDLARAAGISKKTIYQEFADKKDLVKEVFAKILEEDHNKIIKIQEGEDKVIEHLVKMSQLMSERLTSINPLVIVEVQKYFPEAWKMFEEFKTNRLQEDLVKVLDRGIELGYFRAEIDSKIMAKVRINQITSAFDPNNFNNPNFNFVEENLVLIDHFLHGIFTEKGREAYQSKKNSKI